MYSESYYIKDFKTKILLKLAKFLNRVRFKLLKWCSHKDCNKCINHDEYGCYLYDFVGGECRFKEKK